MIGGDGCSGTHLKGEPKGDVIPRKRLRGDDVDTAAAGGYAGGYARGERHFCENKKHQKTTKIVRTSKAQTPNRKPLTKL